MRRITSRSLLLLLLVLGLVSAGCADDGELGGPTVGGALAARIGSYDYTSADLEAEVEQWAANPAFIDQVLRINDIGEPGRRNADFVAFVLSHRTISEQSHQLSAASGYTPSADEINGLLGQIDGSFLDPATNQSLFQSYSAEFRQRIGRDFAYQQNLSSVDPTLVAVPVVSVNPRYGTFVVEDRGIGRVDPPSGPRPQPLSFGL